jgi:hypothetical protein
MRTRSGPLSTCSAALHHFWYELVRIRILCWCRGVLERSEPVPFRLTRNLQTFFTPFGVEGVFITAMAVAAQVSFSLIHNNCLYHVGNETQ